jgi:hypothetical protein
VLLDAGLHFIIQGFGGGAEKHFAACQPGKLLGINAFTAPGPA